MADSAPALVRALKRVLFPTLGRPTMPNFILYYFLLWWYWLFSVLDYFLGAAHPSLSVEQPWSASEVREVGAWERALPSPLPRFFDLICQVKCKTLWKKTSSGVFHPKDLRGRRFNSSITASTSFCVTSAKEVRLGKN